MEETTTTTQKYPRDRYRVSIRKANKKYRINHRDKIREFQRDFYNRHKDEEDFKQVYRDRAKEYYEKKKNDPEFMKLKCENAKARYWKLKELKLQNKPSETETETEVKKEEHEEIEEIEDTKFN